MTYQMFIQTNRDGTLENFFFDSVEALLAKKAELDAELTPPEGTADTGEVESPAAPPDGGETPDNPPAV